MSYFENKTEYVSQERPWLTLMYITNRPEVALIAEKNGVERIWIDLETRGKAERQPGNTVKSNHTVDDIKKIKPLLTKSELLVRIEPWDSELSPPEIDSVIDAGADMIMLPMWKTPAEVRSFTEAVAGRVRTTLLLETREALECADDVLSLGGFDEIHIGLNDLHISYGMNFMFQPLADGKVEQLCAKFKKAGIPYGFGGIARLGHGELKAEKVIMEHYRLGSTRAILSRSFCNANTAWNTVEIEQLFTDSICDLYAFERYCRECSEDTLNKNRDEVVSAVEAVVAAKKGGISDET